MNDEALKRLREAIGSEENMLRVTLEDEEADYLLAIVTMLSGGETLTEREQLILLLGVRFMLRRQQWHAAKALDEAVANAIGGSLN
jgi:hypothetical protein